MKTKIKKGFTLIEVLIYIALTGFLISTAFLSAFSLTQEADRLRIQAEKADQSGFIALISAIFLSIIMTLSIASAEYVITFHEANVENKIKNQQIRETALSNDDYAKALILEDPNYTHE